MSSPITSRFLDLLGVESSKLKSFRHRVSIIRTEAEIVPESTNEGTAPIQKEGSNSKKEEGSASRKEEGFISVQEVNPALLEVTTEVNELQQFSLLFTKELTAVLDVVTQRKTEENERKFDGLCDDIVNTLNSMLKSVRGVKDDHFEFTRADLFENIYSQGLHYRLLMLRCTLRPLLFVLSYVSKRSAKIQEVLTEMGGEHAALINKLDYTTNALNKLQELTRV